MLNTLCSPFYVETQYSFYQLGMPSDQYLLLYRPFYVPRRAAQIVISTLIINPDASLADFLDECSYMDQSILGRNWEPKDFVDAHQFVVAELKGSKYRKLLKLPLLKSIADGTVTNFTHHRRRRRQIYGKPGLNLDTAVLEVGNQNQTTVTPLIAQMAFGLFQDFPYVLDFKNELKEELPRAQWEEERLWLTLLLQRFSDSPGRVIIDNRHKIRGASDYLEQVAVAGEILTVRIFYARFSALSHIYSGRRCHHRTHG